MKSKSKGRGSRKNMARENMKKDMGLKIASIVLGIVVLVLLILLILQVVNDDNNQGGSGSASASASSSP